MDSSPTTNKPNKGGKMVTFLQGATGGVGKEEEDKPKAKSIKIDHVNLARMEPSIEVPVVAIKDNYSKLIDLYSYVSMNKMYVFKVNKVNSPSNFFVEYMCERISKSEFSDDDKAKEGDFINPTFYADLQFFYNVPDLQKAYELKTAPVRRRLYACRVGNKIERVDIVLKSPYKRQVDALMIDRGHIIKFVDYEKLYELATIFTDPPARGFCCYLADIRPRKDRNQTQSQWSEEVNQEFSSRVLGKRVLAHVKAKVMKTFEDCAIPQCKLGVTLYQLKDKSSASPCNESIQMGMIKSNLAESQSKASY